MAEAAAAEAAAAEAAAADAATASEAAAAETAAEKKQVSFGGVEVVAKTGALAGQVLSTAWVNAMQGEKVGARPKAQAHTAPRPLGLEHFALRPLMTTDDH